MDTRLIENYLARYINRIAISKNRLRLVDQNRKVSIIYNDYRNQKNNEAPPKAMKVLSPLVASTPTLTLELTPNSGYYGLHSTSTSRAVRDQIPHKMGFAIVRCKFFPNNQ